jgi:outer membrane protein TolC
MVAGIRRSKAHFASLDFGEQFFVRRDLSFRIFFSYIRIPASASAFFLTLVISLYGFKANTQVLTIKDAIQNSLNNYGTIKAKATYLQASRSSVKQASLEYLPNLNFAAQQAYGTVNGQFGPLIASGGLNAGSAGPPFASQNWAAAFGGLYLANVNWDFFSFGRARERVRVAQEEVMRAASDLEQERFQHEVRVAAAYLNLLAAQRLKLSQQRNLERASAFRMVVVVRAKNGLNAGVDSSLANAELSNARIALTNAQDYEQQQAAQLAQLMGVDGQNYLLDTVFINRLPAVLKDSSGLSETHPVLKYFRSRIEVSRQQEKYYDRFKYPVFSLIGVLQSRGTGFQSHYSEQYPDAYTHNFWDGVKPVRSNYLIGVGVSWNITTLKRVHQQVSTQELVSRALQNEYELANQQLRAQLVLADQRIQNAIANFIEAPVQMKAATDAYLQKTVLYRNGLANIVDVTQALYTLNRAETDRDISNNNVWQALLLKAAARGDFNLFMKEFQ